MDRYRVSEGTVPNLGGLDTRDRSFYPDVTKKQSVDILASLRTQLADLQRLLWADGGQALLVVFQAMDTGGKDGTIRKVFTGVNPQGVTVTGFGVPTDQELAHDYLWRVHERVPAKGRIGVFNRSHYEDVLVVRVNQLVEESRWRKRYAHIVDFERLLSDEGTRIVKIMLHISKDEQRERLQARLNDPAKNFKFNPGDLAVRKLWDTYMGAYEEAIAETSTDASPWYIVPADRKWYRNLVVAQILIDTLKSMDLAYPVSEYDLTGITVE